MTASTTSPRTPRLALIGAVAAAAPPTRRAFAEVFPEAELWNLLDDLLITDALEAGRVTPELAARMTALIDYAIDHGADGVLLTCSMYGPVAHAVGGRASIPVLASDDAAFASAASGGFSRIALVGSLPIPLADAHTRFTAYLAGHGVDPAPEIVDVLASGAAGVADATAQAAAIERAVRAAEEGASGAGGHRNRKVGAMDAAPVDAIPVDAVPVDAVPVDAVLLAQYSISPAAPALTDSLGIPVLAGPVRAAAHLHTLLGTR